VLNPGGWRSSGYGRWTRFSTAAHPEEVATALGLHGKTVYGWLKKYRDGGQGALLVRPVPGRPPRLAPLQMRRLWTLVAGTDPRQLQFDFALWTTEMVRALIRREFGVGLSAVSVGRLLGKMGLSQQRPLWRAYQQNPEAVTRWKQEEYPAIAAAAAARAPPSTSLTRPGSAPIITRAPRGRRPGRPPWSRSPGPGSA
jgi:transposase